MIKKLILFAMMALLSSCYLGCATYTMHKVDYDSTGKIVVATTDLKAQRTWFITQSLTSSEGSGVSALTYNTDTSAQLSGFMTNILNAAVQYGTIYANSQGVPVKAPVIPTTTTTTTSDKPVTTTTTPTTVAK